MIGRALDWGLSYMQSLRNNLSAKRNDESLLYYNLLQYLRCIVLPVEQKEVGYREDEQGRRITDNNGNFIPENLEEAIMGFGSSSLDPGYIKKDCAKAFEKRRKVKVGESFEIRSYSPGYFSGDKKQIVTRVSKNAVEYGRYVISSSKKELLKHAIRTSGYGDHLDNQIKPVHYKWVIW